MKIKQKVKMLVDICMTILLFVLMAFHYVGLQWHEVTGAAMLILFILHHILNGSWYRALGKGKYPSGRILLTVVDTILLIDMFLLMFSGISMSRYVFRFLDIPVSKAWARGMHMTASYAGFLLMGFHIGLHYGMILLDMVYMRYLHVSLLIISPRKSCLRFSIMRSQCFILFWIMQPSWD